MKKKKSDNGKSTKSAEQPESLNIRQDDTISDEGEVNPAITDQAFLNDITEPEVKNEGIVANFDNAADNEEKLIAKKEAVEKVEPTKKPFRPAIFGLGVVCGLIVAMIIFGVFYYLAGEEVCSGYNSVTNSEKKLTSLITSQKNRDGATLNECSSDLTEAEKNEIADWKTYQNEKYNISFKIPSDWLEKSSESANQFSFESPEVGAASLIVGMDLGAISLVKDGYKLVSSTTQNVACQKAKVTIYTDKDDSSELVEKYRQQIVKLSVSDIPYQFDYNWQTGLGASISTDYLDRFNLILKTVVITQ